MVSSDEKNKNGIPTNACFRYCKAIVSTYGLSILKKLINGFANIKINPTNNKDSTKDSTSEFFINTYASS